MQAFQVRSEGPLSHPLRGSAHVGGAKNSALKLMAAALLARGRTTVTNVPDILDVHVMARLLEELGCTVAVTHPDVAAGAGSGSGRVTIDVPDELGHVAPGFAVNHGVEPLPEGVTELAHFLCHVVTSFAARYAAIPPATLANGVTPSCASRLAARLER